MAELEQIRITYPNTTNPEDFHNDFSNLSLNSTTSLAAPTEDDTCDMSRQYLVDKLFVKLTFFLLYFIIFCLGFFGNILGKNQKVFHQEYKIFVMFNYFYIVFFKYHNFFLFSSIFIV